MKLEKRISDKINNNNFNITMPFPEKNLLIEVTNYCNNKCIFCYNSCMKRKKKFIDYKLCRKVLEDAYKLGMREVGFYVAGEPLLDKRLPEFISIAKNLGYKYIYLTTNGILASLSEVKKLYNNGLNSIKYSINAYCKEDYEVIHGTNNFNKVIKNLEEVYSWKKTYAHDLNLFVSYISLDKTKNSKKIEKIFYGKCDEYVVMPAINQGGLIPNISKVSSKCSKDINNNIKIPCPYPFNTVVVTVEGYLTACCMDFENLLAYANLNNENLKDAWNNDIIKKLRKMHLTKKVNNTICYNCIYNTTDVPQPISNNLCHLNNIDENIFSNKILEVLNNESN